MALSKEQKGKIFNLIVLYVFIVCFFFYIFVFPAIKRENHNDSKKDPQKTEQHDKKHFDIIDFAPAVLGR